LRLYTSPVTLSPRHALRRGGRLVHLIGGGIHLSGPGDFLKIHADFNWHHKLQAYRRVNALLYLPDHPRSGLDRALRIPALSPGWRGSLQALRDQADDAGRGRSGNSGLTTAAPAPAWSGFRPLRVVGIEAESRTVSSLRLVAPDGAPLPAALPGQFVTVRLQPSAGGASGDRSSRRSASRSS